MTGPGAGAAVLELRGVAVERGGVRLLGGLDLRLRTGELVALSGPSGCGKTSLLRVISGLDDAAAGTIALEGRAPAEIGWPAFRRRVVRVAQRPVMLPGTLRANLERPFRYRVAHEAFPAGRAAALLERVQVETARLDQDARSLSVGQQQRAALVRALLVRPQVLLLDEPTSALDPGAVTTVEDLIRAVAAEERLACLVVTHDAALAARWCDRTLALSPAVVDGEPARA